MSQEDTWKESLMDLALLQIELEELGGPSENAALHDNLQKREKKLLGKFGLPDNIDFLKLLYFENIPGETEISKRIEALKNAATRYLLTEARPEIEILQEAKINKANPFEVLPGLNIKVHIYTIFVYDKILLSNRDSLENIWNELQLARDPQVLDYTGRIGLKEYDFEEPADYRKLLKDKGLRYLDLFIETQAHFLEDSDF